MSEFKIEIERLNFNAACDKCDKVIQNGIKVLTIDTAPESVGGELVVICQACLTASRKEIIKGCNDENYSC